MHEVKLKMYNIESRDNRVIGYEIKQLSTEVNDMKIPNDRKSMHKIASENHGLQSCYFHDKAKRCVKKNEKRPLASLRKRSILK